MSVNMLVNSIRNYLVSHHMYADDEWLSGCVEYLTEDSNNLTESELQSLAREQWLLNDLKDICPGSLPRNLKDQAKTVLNGRYVLQINAAEDVGSPAYQQYLKLQKVNMENVEATTKFEDKISNHRMIKLYLTDGVQELSAIEYKPMRNLSCDVTPGCKIIIKGPIECRRGILLLTESAIELLGGEVLEIAVTNSLAGLLSTKLGLPMTQETDHNTTISHPRNTNIPTPHTQMPPVMASQTFEPTLEENPRPVAIVTSIQVANFVDEDIDMDQLDAIEAQLHDIPGKRPLNVGSSKPEKKPRIEPVTDINEYPDDNDLLFEEDEDYLRELEAKIDAEIIRPRLPQNMGPVALPAEPFVYVKQINEMDEIEKAGRVFKVKGQIMKLLSKLSVGKDGWSLRCTIVDGTGNLDVDFTSDVLSKLVGFTPQEMAQLKKQMATKPELKEKAVVALQKAKDTLQILYSLIEITILEVPKITGLTPFDSTHVTLLKRRMESSGL